MTLRLRPGMLERIRSHLLAAYPEEGCGALLGRDEGGARVVERVALFENRERADRERRYEIAPDELLAAEREARDACLDVVGFFHSHPDRPARPSAFDLERAWPYYSYLIVRAERSGAGEARSWRLADDRSQFLSETIEAPPETEPTRTAENERP